MLYVYIMLTYATHKAHLRVHDDTPLTQHHFTYTIHIIFNTKIFSSNFIDVVGISSIFKVLSDLKCPIFYLNFDSVPLKFINK